SSTILKPADRPLKVYAEDVAGHLCSDANADISVSVTDWLHVLNLDQYANNFMSRGYDSMQHIKDFGIHNDDLDYMGITHPLHRRVLKIAAISEYSEVLLTGIQDWQEIGSVVVYKVVSRWRFSRSCVFLRYGEFKKLHSNILKSLTGPECAKLLSKLPELPGKGNMVIQSRSAAFCTQR
ncbi:Samd5, partial [Symbiodinium microadriaticum]